MSQPTKVGNLQCFLDMVNYLNKYSQLADTGNNMHETTKKNASFGLDPEQTDTFEAIKEITIAPILKHYDPAKHQTFKKIQA